MKKVLIVCLLSWGTNSFANKPADHRVDSLSAIVARSLRTIAGQTDTATINRLNVLAERFIEINADSSLFYGGKAIELSRKINYKAGIAGGLLQTGHARYFKGNFAEAKKDFDEAFLVYQSLKDKKGIGNCYGLYGKALFMQAQYPAALQYLNLALDEYDKEKNKLEIANCYNNIGMVYFGESKHSIALDYYYKALFIDIRENNKYGTADIYNNIGDVLQNLEVYPKAFEYYKKALQTAQETGDLLEIGTANENIGEVLLAQKFYDDAIVYLSKSIKIAIQQDDQDGISYISADLGLCYSNKNQIGRALEYLNTSLTVAHKNKIVYDEAYALISYATVFNRQKDYKNACKYALEGQALALGLGNFWFQANSVLELYKCLAGMGRYEEAFKYSKEYNDLKDSLKVDEGIQKLTSYNLTINFTAKQQQLLMQQQEKEILYQQKIKQQKLEATFGFAIVVMIIISIFYYRQKRRQQKAISLLGDKNREILLQKADLDEQTLKLNDSNQLKDRLIAILAHDLRAPLSTLRGVFSLLLDETISIDDVLEMVPTVIRKLEYTSDFLDTLLFWINSQVGNFGNSAKRFCLKNIVEYEITNQHDQVQSKGIKLNGYVPDDIFAFADPDTIRIVIRNLVTNAVKFSRANDTIEISALLHEDKYLNNSYYLVSVKDTGIGMSEDQLSKLFKGKVNSGVGTNNESGTGMGMLFCKDLIERNGGKIWVKSTRGSGTQFLFTVPVGAVADTCLEIAC